MIKANFGVPGIMWQAADGDLSAITLLDTDPITPTSRAWEIECWPDNLASAPTIANATGNPATFTPPQSGEWYQVLLTRTVGAATFQERLQICIPDATGTYALPAPGMQADTDPTKTLVNKNAAAKAIGWAGGVRATMPGISGAIRKAIDDAAAANTPASDILPGTQSISHFIRTENQPLDIEEAGANGNDAADNFTAIESALALSDAIHVPVGIFKISTSGTLGVAGQSSWKFAPGGKLHIPNGVTLTLNGYDPACAPTNQQIFVVDVGGALLLDGLIPKVGEVESGHFGAFGASTLEDNAIPVSTAIAAASYRGLTVRLPRSPPLGYFPIRSPIYIGSDSLDSSGVRLVGNRTGYSYPDFVAVAAFPSGLGMIEIINSLKGELVNLSLDANGNADYCIHQYGSADGVHLPAWSWNYHKPTTMGARVHGILMGAPNLLASYDSGTHLFESIEHPLVNTDEVHFVPYLENNAPPTSADYDTIYFVVNKLADTFQLSATSGGSPINFAAAGHGWYISKKDTGDCSVAKIEGAMYLPALGNSQFQTTVDPISHRCFKSEQAYCITEIACWNQGTISPVVRTFTANAGTNVITTTLPALANGDILKMGPDTGAVMPSGVTVDTEYYARDVSGTTCKLAASPGGSVVALGTTGSGTLKIARILKPYHGKIHQSGTVKEITCTGTAMYCDSWVRGRPGSVGFAGRMIGCDSQSWSVADCDTSQTSGLFPQIGGYTFDVDHLGSPFWISRKAIRWNVKQYANCKIDGSYASEIVIGSATTGSVDLRDVQLHNDERLVTVTGDAAAIKAHVQGRWRNSGTEDGRYLSIQNLSGAILADSTTAGLDLGIQGNAHAFRITDTFGRAWLNGIRGAGIVINSDDLILFALAAGKAATFTADTFEIKDATGATSHVQVTGTAATFTVPIIAPNVHETAEAFVNISTDQALTATSYTDLLTASITTSGAGDLEILFTFSASTLVSGATFRTLLDGVSQVGGGTTIGVASNASAGAILFRISAPSAASHTVKIQYTVTAGGTLQIRPATAAEHASLLIKEV